MKEELNPDDAKVNFDDGTIVCVRYSADPDVDGCEPNDIRCRFSADKFLLYQREIIIRSNGRVFETVHEVSRETDQ